MNDPPPPVLLTDPSGAVVSIQGANDADQAQIRQTIESGWAKDRARTQFIAEAAEGARQAILINQQIRAANANNRAGLQAFIGGVAPAGTAVEQLAWLYARVKDLAGVVLTHGDQVDTLTRESDGLINLFASVIPALDDLLDSQP